MLSNDIFFMFLIFLLSSQSQSSSKIDIKDEHGIVRNIRRNQYPIPNEDSSYSYDAVPFQISVAKLEKDYSTNDINSIVDQIANEFEIERNKLQNFFNLCKWSSTSKQLFNKIDFNQIFDRYRAAKLSGTVIKVTNNHGSYIVNCRQARAQSILMHKPTATPYSFGGMGPEPFFITKWRLITTRSITFIYNELNSKIEPFINIYKHI